MTFVGFSPIFLLGVGQSDEHICKFGGERFILQGFPVFNDGSLDVLKMKEAVCLDDVGFAEFFVGCDVQR